MTFSIKSVLIHECQYKPTQINTIQHASDKVGISFKSQYYLKVIKKLILLLKVSIIWQVVLLQQVVLKKLVLF